MHCLSVVFCLFVVAVVCKDYLNYNFVSFLFTVCTMYEHSSAFVGMHAIHPVLVVASKLQQ